VGEQPPLDRDVEAVVVAGEAADPARGDDSVAGDREREVVRAARLADRARARADVLRHLAVAADAARGDLGNLLPDAALVARADRLERQLEPLRRIGEVALDLRASVAREPVLRGDPGSAGGEVEDLGDALVLGADRFGADPDRAERRRHHRVEAAQRRIRHESAARRLVFHGAKFSRRAAARRRT
jgi:hypothetical protein